MAREVNVYYEAVRATGRRQPVAEYALTVRHDWTKAKGGKASKESALTFPAVLDNMPEERRLAYVTEILLAEARILAGVDE